ncbi:MAG: hypothetical protein Q4G60_14640, partial [bacterium]|nr:hypothetical protein [bacterium]
MNQLEYSDIQKTIYRSTCRKPFIIDVPAMNFLMFDGTGHPSGSDFQTACEALYTLSYIIKFDIARKQLDTDYKVNPMEVKWNLDKSGATTAFTWTMMIMQPDFITQDY